MYQDVSSSVEYKQMRDKIAEALQKVTGQKNIQLETPEIEVHGDYAANVALQLKTQNLKLKTKKPGEIAEGIGEKLQKDKELAKIVDKIEVAGPGFINFFLSKEALLENLTELINRGEKYGTADIGKGKTVVIDYSAPNIAKRFGIGHLCSTVIGQALYNLYKALGYKVIGDNHLGDWGTQFGTLLYKISNSQLTISNLSIDKLEELYVDFNKKADEDPKLWDKARAWFKKLEEGDGEARRIWKAVVDISMAEFSRIYGLLGVKIDFAYGESFYENKMPAVIEEARKKGLVVKSQGAEIMEFKNSPPAMLIKSDGATTYFTRDLATIKFRIKEWNPILFIYEVGADQILHFKQVFAAVKLLGWKDGREFVHIPHGLIRFKHGKMSTRKGETIKLEDVLNEAIDRAREIIEKSETPRLRSGQAGRGLTEKEKYEVAKAVGIGAIKYFDLKHHPTTDIVFDWEKMFVLEGNSAPYLQYTFARTQSVLAKARNKSKFSNFQNSNLNTEELLVLRSLVHFPEVVEAAAKSYSPNLLANYLFDLAQKFNAFYNKYRILPPEKEIGNWKLEIGNFRLSLTAGVGQVLKTGLALLGIQAPQRM